MEKVVGKERGAAMVVGASGGLGGAVLGRYLADTSYQRVVAISRGVRPSRWAAYGQRLQWLTSDYSEESITTICTQIGKMNEELHRVVICNGILHNERLAPEKALEKVTRQGLLEVFEANMMIPSLWLSTLVKNVRSASACVIAVLSARVGSIGDNRLGGWYSYRSSKAALNMFLKTASIEFARRAPAVKLVAFHPGTVDTALSRPFQRRVSPEKLFSPAFVAERLTLLLDQQVADGELSFIDWDARPVPW